MAVKAAPVPQGSVTCTIDAAIHADGATYTFVGSVTGMIMGQP